ncbi:glutamate synthase large subunit [Paenibacillus sp. MSJ-34]|uniref:glutamate synthase large subunit n=1 Tax=Paenibacillus sp. MSJ-34 TaxID=2841529 RepID=UPI001C11D052|nr:glutamate synthase large subunit [Paenibacillus sp. MSJ-34]MBU5442336.1 glutamate synthase large subunit [Paenibacillus sp. MSJ-34]
MALHRVPERQGLYDPIFERDACGIGFLANMKGEQTHSIVSQALDILYRLKHRGGQGADPESGDGAGILTQLPHRLLDGEFKKQGLQLPEAGRYGVGMVFLPQREAVRLQCEQMMERIIGEEGQVLLGWRTVPTDDGVLGQSARATKPFIRQVIVAPPMDNCVEDELAFERKLYLIRRRIENGISAAGILGAEKFYIASFSSKTIVYKGLLLPEQLSSFYTDLRDPAYESALALVHSRFSTNTFPSWERAHPNRYMIHNGEINTIKGNVNWMRAREKSCQSPYFEQLSAIRPIIDDSGSDSSMMDNAFEFLLMSGRSIAHAAMMMIPEPWLKDKQMSDEKRAFYEYHSCLMEPWDGPAAIAFTDGKRIGACLDRNGLRPARYYVTSDDTIVLSSEVGVIDIPAENIVRKDRLRPGQMLLVDTVQGRIVPDDEIKREMAEAYPYRSWLNEHLVDLRQRSNGPDRAGIFSRPSDKQNLLQLQRVFGFSFEELNKMLKPLAEWGEDPVGSMGYDAPLAVLSKKPQLLYNYFKQMFAQVTNPPIDAFLEEMITSVETTIGPEYNLLETDPRNCRKIRLKSPVLSDREMAVIRDNRIEGFRAVTLRTLFTASEGSEGLEQALQALFEAADQAIAEGASLLVLSDRGVNGQMAPIPALLASAGLHHHLIRQGTRTQASILVQSGEPREVHHMAALLSYGANAVHPYLAFESIAGMIDRGALEGVTFEQAANNYVYGVTKGILKVISKMGISTVQSYIGAQIFEAIGIDSSVIDRYFTWTPSRVGGIDMAVIAQETLERHRKAYAVGGGSTALEAGDDMQWRKDGEEHLFSPQTIHTLQQACWQNDYELFKRYSRSVDEQAKSRATLRGLLEFASNRSSVPLEEVEPIESIMRRFKTGAMSFGSISREAHEALAIAMNRIGGRSNSGEGGEDPDRFTADGNGELRNSAIKQVASGRFGVSSHYLMSADEIQIKMAQGAKPGEGGQLPAHKVYPWIAKARGSTPGVELISPPPHHDIYSIEDLAELIFDVRNANPKARINVKLVSEAGVGTIAAGVAKAQADVILISGYDGGTGAASRTSIKHAGMPWEIGLAEAQQTLALNGLRGRVTLETDGKLMSGRDVVIAALLGAEEFGFSTVPLVVLGCIMMRVCHLDTCPVGIATQNPDLRRKFKGDPDHIVHFMQFIAAEAREWMAELGFRTMDEMIGRTDMLQAKNAAEHWKAHGLDLSALLHRPEGGTRSDKVTLDRGLGETLDAQKLIPLCRNALERKEQVQVSLPIGNADRSAGTMLGSEVTRRYGAEGLPEDTIRIRFAGSAGQSFGAFVPKGVTLLLEGDANDYVGKGLSGGTIAVYPPERASFKAEDNVIIGNTALYGATAGEAYIRGIAGERFCVRNSGANVVVEGVGNHGCEYMTGGHVVVLGAIGQNFAAGMSGGIAYVLGQGEEPLRSVESRCNVQKVLLEPLADEKEIAKVRSMIERHAKYTRSSFAESILRDWDAAARRFVRIVPKEYKRVMEEIERFKETGKTDMALLAATQD